MHPASGVRGEAPGRHDAMHVGMADEGLPPRVEDAEEADPGTEMPGGRGHLEERVGAGAKQQLVDQRGVATAQDVERMGQGEDHVDVGHGEQLALPRGEPPLPRVCLALRTVPVATRVVRDRPMPARVTLIQVTTKRGRPTASEGPEHGPVLDAQPRMPCQEVITLGAEDIGHFYRWPTHAYDRRKRENGGVKLDHRAAV